MKANRVIVCDECGSRLLYVRTQLQNENGRYADGWRWYCPECDKFVEVKAQ